MKQVLTKKSVKRMTRSIKSKTTTPVAEPAGRILEMHPSHTGMHHGLTLGSIILVLVAVGSLATSVFEYQKMKAAIIYAGDASLKLSAVEAKNNDLSERLKEIETVGALAAKTPVKEVILKEYSSSNLSLFYPTDYTVQKATAAFPALTVKNTDLSKVEIFRIKDFPGGKRSMPDGVVASKIGSMENTKVVPYDVWVYMGSDETANDQLDKIVASIKIIK